MRDFLLRDALSSSLLHSAAIIILGGALLIHMLGH